MSLVSINLKSRAMAFLGLVFFTSSSLSMIVGSLNGQRCDILMGGVVFDVPGYIACQNAAGQFACRLDMCTSPMAPNPATFWVDWKVSGCALEGVAVAPFTPSFYKLPTGATNPAFNALTPWAPRAAACPSSINSQNLPTCGGCVGANWVFQ